MSYPKNKKPTGSGARMVPTEEWEGEGIDRENDLEFIKDVQSILEKHRDKKTSKANAEAILRRWISNAFPRHRGRPGQRGGSLSRKDSGVFSYVDPNISFIQDKPEDETSGREGIPASEQKQEKVTGEKKYSIDIKGRAYKEQKDSRSQAMGSKIQDLKKTGSFYASVDGVSPLDVNSLQPVSKSTKFTTGTDKISADLISEYTSQYYELLNQENTYLHGWVAGDSAYLDIVQGVNVNAILRRLVDNSFPDHKGRPGKRGGSLPRDAGAGADSAGGDSRPTIKEFEVREQDKKNTEDYLYSEAGREVLKRFDLTPEEAEAEVQKAREASAKLPSTKSIHTDKDGNYTKERQALHDKIVDDFISKGESSDNPKLLLSGGLPGSGKSTILAGELYNEYDSGFVAVDSDAIKGLLAKADGLDAVTIEAAAYHEESNDVVSRVFDKALSNRMNIIYDNTMRSETKTRSMVDGFIKGGYEVEIAFTDLPPEKAMARAVGRYLGGGRFVDPNYIATHDHKNPKTAESLASYASVYRFWDNDVPFGEPPILVKEILR